MFAGFLGERRGDVIQPGFTRTTIAGLTTNANGAPIPFTFSNPFGLGTANPTPIPDPVGNADGKQTAPGQGISFFNQNPKISKQARFQIGVQRELKGGWIAEAEFVGNRGYDIEITRNINALPLKYLNGDNSLTAEMTANDAFLRAAPANSNPFQGLLAGSGLNNSTIAHSQLLLAFPEFGAINTTNNDGKSWYYSGQFSLQKRFSKGYTVQASYTWSKWIQATEYLNAADPLPSRVISDQDSPHRVALSAMYAFPFGKGARFLSNSNWFVDNLFGGWQIGGTVQLQSGFPIAFGDLFYKGGRIDIPSAERGTNRWFNTSAFASNLDWPNFLPAGVTSATATTAQIATARTAANTAATPVNHLRSLPLRFSSVRRDYIKNVDLTLKKDIKLNETMKIQLRFEALNAFNEPYFPAPVVAANSTEFGKISASNQDNYARRIQLGLKFIF